MSGFYKQEGKNILHGPNFVFGPDLTLIKEDIEEYLLLDIFPVDGWYWFDSTEEAYAFFGVPMPQQERDMDGII